MTFVLKELSVLRKQFDDTVAIMLLRDKKGKIEDLSNPRKYELQFLSSILTKLEEQQSKKSNPYHANVFYGAMLAVMQDIENNRGTLHNPGLLSGRLAEIIGINPESKAEDKPDLYQTAKFHTALNVFLNQVFVENDSSKGFEKEHVLTAIPTANLSKLIKTSYTLEKDAQKTIIAALAADGKTKAKANEYKAQKKSPASATERFGGLAKLNKELDELILKELASKNVTNIEKLSLVRSAQIRFLNATRESLKTATLDETEQVAVLAGAMHLVRKQIFDEYAGAYIGNLEHSVIYMGLNNILGKDNVKVQDVEALVTSSTQYLAFMTIQPKVEGKKAIRSEHILSKIPGCDLKAILNLHLDIIHSCRRDAVSAAVDKYKKEASGSEKTASVGYFSAALGKLSFLGGAKKSAEDSDDEEQKLEHTHP